VNIWSVLQLTFAKGIVVRTVIAEGHPHEEIVLFAEREQVDLIGSARVGILI